LRLLRPGAALPRTWPGEFPQTGTYEEDTDEPPAATALTFASFTALAADRAWINGRWFDGETFVSRTFYTVDGRLTTVKPAAELPVQDLGGRFVVPPYGDAHHHGIDREEALDTKIAAFLKQGIFYVKNPNVIPDFLTERMRARLNQPDSIDVVFSNGGLTGSGGHPGPLHDSLASRDVFPGMKAADMGGRAYFYVDSVAQLETKWPVIVAGKPDFIKTYLNGDHRLKTNSDHHSHEAGLTPKVLRAVVEKAHRVGLRVSTHVDTAADFRVAADAGVDEISHMPLVRPQHKGAIEASFLSLSDARAAAGRNASVVATANVLHRFSGQKWSAMDLARHVASQRHNLKLLKNAGVPVAIGSDGISGEVPFVTAANVDRDHRGHHLSGPTHRQVAGRLRSQFPRARWQPAGRFRQFPANLAAGEVRADAQHAVS
jgi:hypothetical protein